MTSFLLVALCCAGDGPKPAPLERFAAAGSLGVVAVTADMTPTNSRGLQIVTVRLKLLPTRHYPGQKKEYVVARPIKLKLAVTTRDPKTQIQVIYPKGREIEDGFVYCPCEDEIAVQVILQRADGDKSPVQGRLDFWAGGIGH